MNPNIQYMVVDQYAVTGYLQMGWKLYGSPIYNPHMNTIQQAIVKEN